MIEGIKSISSGFEFSKITGTDITGKGLEYKIIFVILVLTEMYMYVILDVIDFRILFYIHRTRRRQLVSRCRHPRQ